EHEPLGPPVVRLPRRRISHGTAPETCGDVTTRRSSRSTLLAAMMACAYALRPRLRSSPPTSEASCMSGYLDMHVGSAITQARLGARRAPRGHPRRDPRA